MVNPALPSQTIKDEANAFAIYSALYAPLCFADYLGATLPNKFAVNYPNNTYKPTGSPQAISFYDNSGGLSGQSCPTIDCTTDAMAMPDTIGHEFGHLVAFQNGVANREGDVGSHWFEANLRGTLAAGQKALNEAMCEGWADFYSVCSNIFSQSIAINGTVPTNGIVPVAGKVTNLDYNIRALVHDERQAEGTAQFLFRRGRLGNGHRPRRGQRGFGGGDPVSPRVRGYQ